MRSRVTSAVTALAAAVLAVGACSTPSPPAGGTPPPAPAAGRVAAPAVASTGTPAGSPSPSPSSAPEHIVVVVFENKSYRQLTQPTQAPWLHGLMAGAAVFTDAHAVTHPSQPNYLALFSGSTQGITDDHCPVSLGDRPNLARQLLDAGRTFVGYAEDLPGAGTRVCGSGEYAAKHNPWADFGNVPASANQPWSAFPSSFADLPTVSFVVPNLCHDMHDCSIGTGDSWAAAHLEAYRQWAPAHRGLLIVTFDEDDNAAANQILTLVSGAGVHPGSYPRRVDHYSVLRTIEDCYGLAPIGQSAAAQPLGAVCSAATH